MNDKNINCQSIIKGVRLILMEFSNALELDDLLVRMEVAAVAFTVWNFILGVNVLSR
jgi:hypothetical protein